MRASQAVTASVRKLRPDEGAALRQIYQHVFDVPWPESECETTLAISGTHVFMMETYDEIVGFVVLRTLVEESEIITIGVCKDLQRQGLGNLLLVEALAALTALGVRRTVLEVAVDNVAAIALYKRFGFCEVARRVGYYVRSDRPAVDALLMERLVNENP